MYIFASSLFGGSGQHRGPVYLFVNSGPEPTGSPAAERERRSMPPKIGTGEGGTRSCEENARRFTDKSLSFERRIGYFENRIASHSSVVLRSQSTREQMIQERKAPAPSSVRDSVYMNAFRNRSLFESVP
ncbi:hypothetical protein HZH68_010682 [Vespula germanica]|uniref:Uncharacterized protein n=1 Tax=Vespula germanica TaxID=30212 RepID=A0A834JSB6_VESGE|nr:hypothetical protein HZH68_010682 [Vespula germanica]